MAFYLSRKSVLKWLEVPSIYQIAKDELYELDSESFRFLQNCAGREGCSSRDGALIDYCMEEGLLTTAYAGIRRPPLKQAPRPSLRYLELQLTDACNLRCGHCYIDDPRHRELSLRRVEAILREFEDMQGLRVLLTGGEPLLHRQFGEINEMLPDYLFRKVLFSNGMLLHKGLVSSLKVDEIQISIDGLEQAHDLLRGKGAFAGAMAAVRLALDAGIDVSVSTMVHRGNLPDFDDMERLFKGLGIKDWTVDVPCPTGRLRKNENLQISPDEGGKYLGYGYGDGLHASDRGYGCGLHLMAVLADGSAAKCTFYGDRPVGTVDEGLAAAWSRIKPVRLHDLSCRCEFLEVCRGGCRFRAELLEGRGGKDLYRCMLYGII